MGEDKNDVQEQVTLIPVESSKNSSLALEAIAKHCFSDAAEFGTCYRIGKNILLGVTSTSISWLYVDPSIVYANGDVVLAAEEVFGTCVSASAAVYNAFKPFIEQLEGQRSRKSVQNFLIKRPKLKQYANNLGIFLGSSLSAIPITAAALAYSQPMPKALLTFKMIVLQWDNTALHFLPMMLILGKPFFKAPFIPLVKLYELCRNCRLTTEELHSQKIMQRTIQDQQQLKLALVSTLEAGRKRIFEQCIETDFSHLTSSVNLPNGLRITNLTDPMELWKEIVSYAPGGETLPPSWCSKLGNVALDLASKSMWLVGMSVVVLAGSGYYKNNYTQAVGLADDPFEIGLLTRPN